MITYARHMIPLCANNNNYEIESNSSRMYSSENKLNMLEFNLINERISIYGDGMCVCFDWEHNNVMNLEFYIKAN
jgi:hypothetical protein